jgi:DNA invertase Pin-like site-specific DNA recombinase
MHISVYHAVTWRGSFTTYFLSQTTSVSLVCCMREQEHISVGAPRIRAAQYLRMSTEHQQYSFDNQSDWNLRYAQAHAMEIVRTYSDVESGVNIRDGLKHLLDDVENGTVDYRVILVYDVSRWGRFLDTDESAYYEYRCKRAGVAVHYCAEQFENDGGFLSSLMKNMKRCMAGEYSRELSVKVFLGQCRIARLGFLQGGRQGYGLRRAIVDCNGNLKQVLDACGGRKAIQTDRVILVPGPEREVRVVNEIYDRLIKDKWSFARIATWINSRGILTHTGARWNEARVRDILTNERYIGTNTFNKRSRKLGHSLTANPPEKWIRVENAFTPVVSRETFQQAQNIIANRTRVLTDAQLLDRLKAFCLHTGPVPKEVVAADKGMPSISAYTRHFGGMIQAYKLIGYRPRCDYSYIELNRQIQKQRDDYAQAIIQRLRDLGASVEVHPHSNFVRVNGEFTAAIICTRCRGRHQAPGRVIWVIKPKKWSGADLAIVVRLKPGNQEILDYYLFPASLQFPWKVELRTRNERAIDVYRFENLDLLAKMVQRSPAEVTE